MLAALFIRTIPFLLGLQLQLPIEEWQIGLHQPAAELSGDYVIEYFPVYGKNAGELRDYLNMHGPIGIDGKRYDAYTEWHISWRWQKTEGHAGAKAGNPDFAKVDVKIKTVVHLPEWKLDLSEGDPTYQSWLQYVEAVKKHEEGHVRQAQYHKAKIERLFESLALEKQELTAKEANELANKIIRQAHRADEFYDILTSHGALQGASWP